MTKQSKTRIMLGLWYLLLSAVSLNIENRGIAQSGSAPALGAGCREFESLYPDQFMRL